MSKTSQCHADLILKCVGHNGLMRSDLSCKHYRESRRTPLQCAYRDGKECFCPEACREAIEVLINNVRISES
jgi:hypothetical protein